jgi:hypothetical protein
MTSRDTNDERWLSESEATDFLRRASQLDAGETVKLRHLREAAVETGLSLEAVDAATREIANGGTDGTPPLWVRFNLAGIPNRAGAQFWYQLLCTAGLASIAGAILTPAMVTPVIGIAAGAWFLGCSAAVSSAIRWMDQHSAWTAAKRR